MCSMKIDVMVWAKLGFSVGFGYRCHVCTGIIIWMREVIFLYVDTKIEEVD